MTSDSFSDGGHFCPTSAFKMSEVELVGRDLTKTELFIFDLDLR
jgi:hypothetical protein